MTKSTPINKIKQSEQFSNAPIAMAAQPIMQQPQQQMPPQHQAQVVMQQQQLPPHQHQQKYQQPVAAAAYYPQQQPIQQYQNVPLAQQQQYQQLDHSNDNTQQSTSFLGSLFVFDKDVKNTLIVMCIFVVVCMIPFHKFVNNYVCIDKFPYSDIIIKTIIIGLLFFVITKLM